MRLSSLARKCMTSLLLAVGAYAAPVAADQCCETPSCGECPGGFQVYGEFLYWKAVQDQTPYAMVLEGGIQNIVEQFNAPYVDINAKIKTIDTDFAFKPGFRVGVGYAFPCTNWDFQLAWTSLHEKITSKVSDNDFGVFPLTMPVSILFGFINRDPTAFQFGNAATSHWKFEFDTIDFEIGRTFCFCNCVGFRPFLGVKLASIRQRQTNEYLGFASDSEVVDLSTKKKNNFQAVGPSVGFDAAWEFCEHWTVSSGLSGALLCGKFDAHDIPTAMQGHNAISAHISNSKEYLVRPMADFSVGIDWKACVCDEIAVLVGVSYEVEYWWNQWQVSPSGVGGLIMGGDSPQGDLMMQGLTVKGAILF